MSVRDLELERKEKIGSTEKEAKP